LNKFHLLLITSRSVHYAFVICGEMRAEHSGRFFHYKHPLAHEERFWTEWPTQWHRCVIERTES